MVRPGILRVVFFGTPQFAVPALDTLLSSRHRVVGVVTQPDRPRGRGQKVSDAPVKSRAMIAAIPILQPQTLRDPAFLSSLAHMSADIGVVAAYGRILSEGVLAAPRIGMINVHASLLPRYRGAAPIHRAVIAGERDTGVTIMRVVKALDAGPMLASIVRPILGDETSEDVERDLSHLGAGLLASTLDRIVDGGVEETPQNDADATYAPRLTKEDGVVDWFRPAQALHNLIRGLHPWPRAHTFLSGHRLVLHRSRVNDSEANAEPGTVLSAHGGELVVATGSGTLALLEIQSEGKRPTTTREFLAGHQVAEGSRFLAQP
jgi:methionyl-tRNA formyltransferase